MFKVSSLINTDRECNFLSTPFLFPMPSESLCRFLHVTILKSKPEYREVPKKLQIYLDLLDGSL